MAGNRRQRRATSEGVDVRPWRRMLRRSEYGERQGWRGGPVPAGAAEAQRQRPRALDTLKPARARTTTRIKGVLRSQGRRLTSLRKCAAPLETWRRWDGSAMPRGRRRRGLRVEAPHALLSPQSAAREAARRALRRPAQAVRLDKGRQLMPRQGIGSKGAGL